MSSEETATRLQAAKALLLPLIESVEAWLPPETAEFEQPAQSPEEIQQHLDRLMTLLSEHNTRATELWREETVLFKTALPNHFAAVDEKINNYDFDSALTLLRGAKEVHG